MRYDDAVAQLFQAPVEQFVAERKRLADALKSAGDAVGAARLAKLARPPVSAWVVDQLWWRARAAFEALFETAGRLRDGQLDAMAAHREAIAALRGQAAKLLIEAEHGATEATLRRVTQTLSALAAAGSWEPDLPGALSADRDPPGFEAVGIRNAAFAEAAEAEAKADGKPAGAEPAGAKAAGAEAVARSRRDAAEARRREELEAAAARAEAAAEQRRAQARRAQLAAEQHRLDAALRTARGDVAQREREVTRLERDLETARHHVAQARSVVEGLEQRLAELARS